MVRLGLTKPVEILLIEDNPADVRMMQEALKLIALRHRLHVVEDGAQAIAFLRQEGLYAAAPVPDLVLVDLNLPRLSGFHVLNWMKKDQDLSRIPIVVLTSSKAEADVRKTHALDANSFITKPVGLDAFVREMRLLKTLLPA